MHSCLKVEEVVEMIALFADIEAEEDWIQRWPPPSAALARTCRRLYEPACNILWRKLQSFEPLLRVFIAHRSATAKPDSPVSLDASVVSFNHSAVVADFKVDIYPGSSSSELGSIS